MNKKRILLLFFVVLMISSCTRRYKGENKTNTTRVLQERKLPKISSDKKIIEEEENKPDILGQTNLTNLFKELEASVFRVFNTNDDGSGSTGSGFLIAGDIGVTNYHVLENWHKNYYIKIDGITFKIERLLKYSTTENLDYAIFRIKNFSGRPLKIAKNRPEIAEEVFTIGSPKGLENSFSKGVISQFRENNRIQIDITIDHGSSGGPLFNMNGEIIGITTSGLAETNADLNFAVDIQALNLSVYSN